MLAQLAVFFLATVTFFRNIGNFPLRNWDEAWYGEIIKNMAGGNYGYIVPFWNGQYYFDKPPLYFWLSLPFFKLFGPGEWQARIVSAAAAVFATLLVYTIGKKLFNPICGLLSALVFLTLGQVVIRFAHGNLDGLLVCLFLLSFYSYLKSEESKVFSLACGIFLGLGFLTKGWFLGLYPALLITLYAGIATKKLPKNFVLIALAALFSSTWWYLFGTIKFAKPFVEWYITNPGSNLLQSPTSSFSLSYIVDFVRDVGLWWPVVIISALKIRKIATEDKKILQSFVAVLFLFIIPLSFLSEKLGWYNLPAYPLVAIIIGYLASKLLKVWPKITVFMIAVFVIVQTVNVIRIENKFPDRSKIGADLGKHAKDIIPKEDTVILDDHDFTSFLYYSNHKMIYMVQNGGGKSEEWWIIDYREIPQIISDSKKTWIVTPDLNSLPKTLKNPKFEDTFEGYTFISFTADTM